jgi:hypothetical protein
MQHFLQKRRVFRSLALCAILFFDAEKDGKEVPCRSRGKV